MKKIFPILITSFLAITIAKQTWACGHEGYFFGGGYSQLLQYSRENTATTPNARTTQRIDWNPRFGGYLTMGHDWCGTRWGMEVPVSVDQQRLNNQELVTLIAGDVNAVYHIAETLEGTDWYWLMGTGINVLLEGPIKDNTGAAGMNLNFGPGFQYFFQPKFALGISVPFKYTLYFGRNLSANRITSVFAAPIRLGFTVGF